MDQKTKDYTLNLLTYKASPSTLFIFFQSRIFEYKFGLPLLEVYKQYTTSHISSLQSR